MSQDESKINKEANNYELIDYLQVGSFIDCKDTVNNWCVAKIVDNDQDKEEVGIHFDGWGQKYDETIPFISNRLGSFRSITVGYTGMKNNTKREDWRYSKKELNTMTKEVEKTIKNEFDNFKSAQEVTQFLRGKLFTFVDSLLANCDDESNSPDDFRDMIEFMEKVFLLIIKWLELFPSKYMEYFEIHKKNKKAFLVNVNVAVAASGNELISMLSNCFGHSTRIINHTKTLKLSEEESETEWYFAKRKDMRFKTALCYTFGKSGGFEAIIEFCNSTPTGTAQDKSVPLIYVNALLESISDVLKEFKNDEKKEAIITEIKKIITSQVDNITDEDIEKLETNQLNNLIDKLKFFGSLSDVSNKEMEETMELTLSYKLLKCPIFERRRQGMINLSNIIESLEDETRDEKYRYFGRKKKKYEWLTNEIFLQWIKDNKIIEYVYGEYSHPEIIRKSGELLEKMCKYHLFSKEELEIIWNVFESNLHEDIVQATLEVVEMIVKSCDEATLDIIRKKIHKFKKKSWDTSMVSFMKNFILAEMENFYQQDLEKKNSGIKNYVRKLYTSGNREADNVLTKEHIEHITKDLELLWKLPLEKGVPDNAKQQAAKNIPEILSNENCSEKTREKYIEMSKSGFKNCEQIYNNLEFIKTLLMNSQTKYGEMRKVNSKYNIISLILTAAEAYLKKLNKIFKDAYDFNDYKWIEEQITEKEPGMMCGRTHKQHIEKMFEIIEYILQRSDGQSPFQSNSEIEKMFSLFISKRISNLESEMLFDLIGSPEKNSRGYETDEYLISDKKIRKFIFCTCMCKKGYVNPHDYTPKSIRCFKDLFLSVNEKEGKLTLDRNDAIIKDVKHLNELEGYQALWEIATDSINSIVQERAGYLLAIIHYTYMDKDSKLWEKETNFIVKELMELLQTKSPDSYMKLNHAKVIRQFIDTYEQLDYPPHFKMFYKKLYEEEDNDEEEMMSHEYNNFYNYKWGKTDTVTFRIEHTETKEQKYLQIPIKETVVNLKKKIGEKFGVGPKQFEIVYGPRTNKFLSSYFDWCYVYELIKEVDMRPDPNRAVEICFDAYEDKDFQERSITYSIAEDPDYLTVLCSYLKKADIATSLETISIIERLPVLYDNLFELKKYIEGHKIQKHDHWYTVLKVKFDQPEELFMKMKLLDNLLNPEKFYEIDMRDQFMNNSGIPFMIDIVVQSCTVLITDGKQDKFPLCASLISKTLKLFSKISTHIPLETVLNQEGSLILMKSGLDFLKYMSETSNENPDVIARMSDQLQKDKIIVDIFNMFTNIVIKDNSRFKTVMKHKKLKEMIFYYLIDTNREYEKQYICDSLINMAKKCNEIGKDNFDCKYMPSEFFIEILNKDYLPIVLDKIYNDAVNLSAGKKQSKKYEEILKLKVMKCSYFFSLFGNMINEVDQLDEDTANSILSPLLEEFQSCKRIELNEDTHDARLSSLIYLISMVFKKCPQIKDSYNDKKLFDFVCNDCLFRRRKDKNEINYPICKTDETREKCLNLLLELMNNKNNKYFSKFAKIITKWMQSAKWRTAKDSDWNIKHFDKSSARKRHRVLNSSDFNGLENLGCTCYMNSVIQQLFMIVPFRNSIQTVKNQREEDSKSEDTLYHTKLLFASLLNTGSSYHNPEHFFKTIKDIDGSNLNPLEQRDADEFLARFFDVLEPQIKGTPEEKRLGNIFAGTYNNQMICIDCPHKSERIEEFTTVPLQVKNKNSLQEGLDSFIESEILQGDNAYYCDKCEKKVSCRRRTCMQKLPNILVIALKRFEIDYNTMQHSKINERVEFPMELDMNKYTDKELEKIDLLKEMEEMNWSYEDLPEDKKQIYDFKYPEQYYTYSLRGIVVHMGEANSGHYYSYIKDTRTGEWYEFNDTLVTPFDPEDMDEKAFGGEYGETSKYSRWRSSGLKPYNAYMLLYERNYYIETKDFMDKVNEQNVENEDLEGFFKVRFSRLESIVPQEEANDKEVDSAISSHNEQIWETKQLFSSSLAKLLYKVTDEYAYNSEGKDIMESVRDSNLHDFDNLPPKVKWVSTFHRQAVTILYFHTAILRSSTKPFLAEYCEVIRNSLKDYFPIAFFYIENFCKLDVIYEFITRRKLSVIRMQVPYFIKLACATVYKHEEAMITEYISLQKKYSDDLEKLARQCKGMGDIELDYEDIFITDHKDNIKEVKELVVKMYNNKHEVPILIVFANKLMKIARDLFADIAASDKYHALSNFFELFYHLAQSGPEMKNYMVQNKFIGRLLDIYYDKKSNNKHYSRNLSDLPTYEIICNAESDDDTRLSSSKNVSPLDIENKRSPKLKYNYALSVIKKRKAVDHLVVEAKEKGGAKMDSDDEEPHAYGIAKSQKETEEKRFLYLLRTISVLVCSCRFSLSGRFIGEDSLFLNVGEPNDIIDTEETVIQEIVSDETMNDLIIRNNMQISTREAISDMYCHLCWENEDVSDTLLHIIIAEICSRECTFATVIKHTPLVVNISKISDSLSPKRMSYLIENLYENTFADNYKEFIKYSDSILNLILQIIRRNYDACRFMRELDSPLRYIEKFNDSNPIPRATGSKQVLFRNLQGERVDKQFSESDKNMLREYSEYRLSQFNELLVGIDWEETINGIISKEGEEYQDPEMVFYKEQPIDYYKEEFKNWIVAEVIIDYGPILQVSYKVPETISNVERTAGPKSNVKINKDSVRSAGVYTNDICHTINGLFLFLYDKAIEKSKSQSYRPRNYGGFGR